MGWLLVVLGAAGRRLSRRRRSGTSGGVLTFVAPLVLSAGITPLSADHD